MSRAQNGFMVMVRQDSTEASQYSKLSKLACLRNFIPQNSSESIAGWNLSCIKTSLRPGLLRVARGIPRNFGRCQPASKERLCSAWCRATLPPPARLQGSGGAFAVLASSLQPAAVQLWLYPRACVHYGELLGGPAHRPRFGLGKDKSKLGSVQELMSKIMQWGGN